MNKAAIESALNTFSVFILFREKLGDRILIKTARDELNPKVRTQKSLYLLSLWVYILSCNLYIEFIKQQL